MESKLPNVIIAALSIVIIVFVFVNGNNVDKVKMLEDERLDYMVEIDELESCVRHLENEAIDYEIKIDELSAELETAGADLYGDAEKYLFLEDEIYYVLHNSPYFHKPYGCFGSESEISDVYYKNSYLPSGYTLCPECY